MQAIAIFLEKVFVIHIFLFLIVGKGIVGSNDDHEVRNLAEALR